jgi:type IV fimbrial biogenesis protein FimT
MRAQDIPDFGTIGKIGMTSLKRIARTEQTGDLQRGLTLVELLVAITIAAVLVSAAIPSFSWSIASYRISGQINGWVGDLQFARAEAIKRGQTVTLCISSNGTSCATGTSAWQSGWIVFADANGNATVDAGETVSRRQTALTGGNTFAADNNVRAITFNREGFAIGLPAGNVTLTLHDPTSASGLTRCVAVTTVGRTSVQRAGSGNCA